MFFVYQGISLMVFPVMSPDQNPIEHMCDEVKRQVFFVTFVQPEGILIYASQYTIVTDDF